MSIINAGDFPIDPYVVDGVELASRLNRLKLAQFSQYANATRPPDITAGGLWSKTTAGGMDLMLYDGTADFKVASIVSGAPVGAPASTITVTPAGSIASTNVQAALQEIDSDNPKFATVAGTANAITATYTPTITALSTALLVKVRATAANTTATPTFAADGTAAKVIVKGSNQALVPGDIAGAGHWLAMQYDATLDKWVLLNPSHPVSAPGRQRFLASGNFTAPPGVFTVFLTGSAGGGAGGGCQANARTGGSGGSGGTATIWNPVAVVPGTVYAVTIGAGGASVVGGYGGAGGVTSFGALMSLPGGNGGASSGYDLGAQPTTPSAGGGSGPGGGGLCADINNLVGYMAVGGYGGGSIFGAMTPAENIVNGVNGMGGNSGALYGGGGSGAVSTNSAGGVTPGGNGAPGFLFVEW